MTSATKRVKLQVQSLKPDGSDYKGYDIQYIPPEDQPIFVEFDLPSKEVTRNDDKSVVISLPGLYAIAEEIYVATRVAETKAQRNTRETAIREGMKK
jgi:hypothetical protein